MNIAIKLSEESLARLAHLKAHNISLAQSPGFRAANEQIIVDLQNKIETYGSRRFKNPTGRLVSSFRGVIQDDGFEVGSELPYARRREFGFSNRTDALGRYYASDPGAFYLKKAITAEKAIMGQYYNVAIEDTFNAAFSI